MLTSESVRVHFLFAIWSTIYASLVRHCRPNIVHRDSYGNKAHIAQCARERKVEAIPTCCTPLLSTTSRDDDMTLALLVHHHQRQDRHVRPTFRSLSRRAGKSRMSLLWIVIAYDLVEAATSGSSTSTPSCLAVSFLLPG
ncbi:hypothetical protein V8F06_005993 [Rhypophila decipiens]